MGHSARPYFKYTGKELKGVYDANHNDIEQLKLLLDELKYRTKPKMVSLRKKVEERLKEIRNPRQQQKAPSTSSSHSQTQLPIPMPSRSAQESSDENSVDSNRANGTNSTKEKPRQQEEDFKKEATQGILFTPEFQYQKSKTHQDTPPGGDGMNKGELGHMRPCGLLTDVPSKWSPPIKEGKPLDVPTGATRLVLYQAALKALIVEMRQKGSGMRRVVVENGKLIQLDGKENGYRFYFEGDQEVFEGATLRAVIQGQHVDGKIVSISGKEIIITLAQYFGEYIAEAILQIDNTAMLEALVKRLEEITEGKSGININIADDVIDNKRASEPYESHIEIVKEECATHQLNEEQVKIVAMALSNAVTYLWGPPGTGKTQSLGALVDILYKMEKRILICSNTNQAVDQVLLKLCKLFGESHHALQDGKIIRVGRIHHNELEKKYSQYVTLDGVIERKSVDLQKEKVRLEKSILSLQDELSEARIVEERFSVFDSLKLRIDALNKEIEKASKQNIEVENRIGSLDTKILNIDNELKKYKAAGVFRRIVMRSEEKINADKITFESRRRKEMAAAAQIKARVTELQNMIGKVKSDAEALKEELSSHERSVIQATLRDGDIKLTTLNSALSEVNSALAEIAQSVMNGAQVVGATVAKSYLSAQQFSNFDVVIIDEASMVLIPALYYSAGLAKEKVIISGDFLQLAPIVPSSEQSVLEIIGNDVFHAAGISDAFFNNKQLPRTIMLSKQYRMAENICALISRWMYDNKLVTGFRFEQTQRMSPPAPYDKEFIIVDTSAVMPFVNRDVFNSRYNLMNGMVVRNLCRLLRDSGFVDSGHGQLGICTPYASQAKLLKRVVDGLGLSETLEAGTVHRYQGDEKELMIMDIPDSLGEYYVGVFLQADRRMDDGAKLFNVAVSRAKCHLIFVANIEYLDRKLPQNAFLRDILYRVQETGNVIDAREVLSLWPISDDLERLGKSFGLGEETLKTGLFNHKDFHTVFMADLENAKSSIAIFSGFFTPNRIAAYENIFRRKLQDGLEIRCVTRPPTRNGTMDVADGKRTLDALESMGVVVDTRWNIHEKVAILDDEVVWFGSLNPLSHTGKTDEVMARFNDKGIASQLATFLTIERGVQHNGQGSISTRKENPVCEQCAGRTTYRTGKFGPFWECENVCGWSLSVGKKGSRSWNGKSGADGFDGQEAPQCDKCGSKMIIRRSKNGGVPFWGCTAYPTCKFTRKANPDH